MTDEVHLKKNEKKSLQKKNSKTQTLSFFLVHEGNKLLRETDFVCSDVDKAPNTPTPARTPFNHPVSKTK